MKKLHFLVNQSRHKLGCEMEVPGMEQKNRVWLNFRDHGVKKYCRGKRKRRVAVCTAEDMTEW